jgi:DNA polymerase-4
MDAFYASVEQRDDPSLKGKPVAVGGPAPRGVVSAASYEAREYGVHSAMPMAKALKLCPQLIVPPLRMDKYAQISRQVFEIFHAFSPLVEPLSLDEAFLDVSGSERLQGSPRSVARAIKARVKSDLDLVVSVGLAPNKFLAKIASDLGKPDGLVVVDPDAVEAFLNPLPVSRVFGVGKVTQKGLHDLGIDTIGELAEFPRALLRKRFGEMGDQLWSLSRGIDDRAVEPERAPKSIGHEDTFTEDLEDTAELEQILLEQADRVARRLRKGGWVARVVVLKAKTHTFELFTRRRSLQRPTSDGDVLARTAQALFARLQRTKGPLKLRLTGVTAAELSQSEAPRQLTFDEPEHAAKDKLAEALDSITDRFGKPMLMRASTLDRARDKQRRKTTMRDGVEGDADYLGDDVEAYDVDDGGDDHDG